MAQRLLGRQVNGEQEKIAWSIVLAQKSLAGLVDALLNSPEYMTTFGADVFRTNGGGSYPAARWALLASPPLQSL